MNINLIAQTHTLNGIEKLDFKIKDSYKVYISLCSKLVFKTTARLSRYQYQEIYLNFIIERMYKIKSKNILSH